MSINNRVPSDATLRRSGTGNGPASKGPARSESVPVDSTKRFGAPGGGPASKGTVTASHTKCGEGFSHNVAPKYQR